MVCVHTLQYVRAPTSDELLGRGSASGRHGGFDRSVSPAGVRHSVPTALRVDLLHESPPSCERSDAEHAPPRSGAPTGSDTEMHLRARVAQGAVLGNGY